jgi:hypothetical protein
MRTVGGRDGWPLEREKAMCKEGRKEDKKSEKGTYLYNQEDSPCSGSVCSFEHRRRRGRDSMQ